MTEKAPLWSILAALLLAGTGAAGATEPPPDPPPGDEPGEIVFAAPTRPDRVGRIMAPVTVNGRGPFAFIIDTGASRSTLAPRVARALGLEPDPTQLLTLRGITGTDTVPSILVEQLQAGDITLRDQRLPVVSRDVFANAEGILGVEGFDGMCLRADFRQGGVTIRRNGCPRTEAPWLRIKGTLRPDRLLQVTARIGGSQVQAIIDTGAEHSLGNGPLREVLERERRRAAADLGETTVLGATSQVATGNVVAAPPVFLGNVSIGRLQVTFGDFEVFRLWELDAVPTLVLGMDVLGTVQTLMVDYRRGELLVLPASVGPTVMFRPSSNASRIRR